MTTTPWQPTPAQVTAVAQVRRTYREQIAAAAKKAQ